MAFDAGMVRAIAYELSNKIVGARVEKIHQPEKDEILLLLHSGRENLRLCISGSANNSRILITSQVKENPSVPPMFCVMLRKHLTGAKISSVEQLGFERVIRIEFESKDDMGFPATKRIYAEIMGKYSNLIITDGEDKIFGVLRPVDFTTSQKRQVLPGMTYELPPEQDKTDPLIETKEAFIAKVDAVQTSSRVDKFITSNYIGISALVAREIAARSALTFEGGKNLVWNAFSDIIGKIKSCDFTPTLLTDGDGKPVEYCFTDIIQYDDSVKVRHLDTVSEVIGAYFSSRDRSERAHQRASDLFKLVHNTKLRLEKKIAAQSEELQTAAKKDEYKKMGDLITGSMYMLKRGMKSASLIDYSDENMPYVNVELDSRLTPAANAQRYYKKYNKAKTAEIELNIQIDIAKSELAYLESVLDCLERAAGQSELDEIRTELSAAGYGAKIKKNQGGMKKQTSKPIEYRTSGGYTVLCGKNNIQNEYITHKTASKNDWWFHVKNAPGSHVVMISNGEEPSEVDFTQAAAIAAYNSSVTTAKNIAVDYTQIRNLKKPAGAKPGFVIYHTNYSAYVTPDKDEIEKLMCK